MSETKALVRLALIQNRISLLCVAALVAIGVAAALFWSAGTNSGEADQIAKMILLVTILPAGVLTLALFDFNSKAELLESDSGYSPWLLRMPIATWKLAMIPVALRTLLTCGVWIACALTVRAIDGYPLALWGPACCFSAIGIWFLVLSWRPFANGWMRLAAVTVGALILYGSVVGVLVAQDHSPDNDLKPWIRQALGILAYVVYGLGVWMSVRAVDLARTNSAGLISANPKRGRATTSISVVAADEAAAATRHYRSPASALIWHDLGRSHEHLRYFVALGVVPAIVLTWLFVTPNAPAFVLLTFVFAYLGIGASTLTADLAKANTRVVLWPYIAASPMSTATIAWTRLLVSLTIMGCALLLSLVAFGSTFLWAENREIFSTWSAQMTEKTGWSHAGFRIAAALFLGGWIVITGRAVAFWWPALTGKQWLHVTITVVFSIGYFVPIMVGIYWFTHQTSWESTAESARYWASFLPSIVAAWLVIKAAGVVAAVGQLRKLDLATPSSIGLMIAGWCLLTGLAAVALDQLIPHQYGTPLWCFAAVAICLPLVRVLVLPVSLYFGRHQ